MSESLVLLMTALMDKLFKEDHPWISKVSSEYILTKTTYTRWPLEALKFKGYSSHTNGNALAVCSVCYKLHKFNVDYFFHTVSPECTLSKCFIYATYLILTVNSRSSVAFPHAPYTEVFELKSHCSRYLLTIRGIH